MIFFRSAHDCLYRLIFKNPNSFIIEFSHLQSWIFSQSITYLYIHLFIFLKLFITKISLTFRFHNDNVWFFFQNRIYVVVLHLFDTELFFLLIQDVLKNENIKLDWDFKVSLLSDAVRVSTKNSFLQLFVCVCLCGDYWGGLQGCRVPDVNLYIHVPYIR